MEISVQYFGMLAEVTGQATEMLSLNTPLTVGALRTLILERYPEFGSRKFKIAVNLQIAEDHVTIAPDAQIALLPPFAGG